MTPTAAQIEILRHALGLDRSESPYRNRYYAEEGHSSWNDLIALGNAGFMDCSAANHPIAPGFSKFSVTEKGRVLAMGQSEG